MFLTKKDTGAAKGFAICLMLGHHLFAFKDRLMEGNAYLPVLIKHDIEFFIGYFGRICVPIFLFLSGYGMFKSFQNKGSIGKALIQKVFNFYKVYWSYLLIFVPIGLMFFKHVKTFGGEEYRYTYDYIIILKNIIGLSNSFNSEWWFVKVYLLLLIFIFPVYRFLVSKNVHLFIASSLTLYVLGGKINIFNELLHWQLSFALGIYIAKHENLVGKLSKEIRALNLFYTILFFCVCVLFRFRFNWSLDFLIAPIFIIISLRFLQLSKLYNVFAYLGKYSFPIWLNHSFFCYYYFQQFVYWPKYSPLVVLTLLGFSLSSAIIIEYLRTHLFRFSFYKSRAEAFTQTR